MADAENSTPEAAAEKKTVAAAAGGGLAQIAVDFGPVAVFMISYNVLKRSRADEAIYLATGLFIAATLLGLGYAFMRQRRVPLMLLVTAVVVTIFGGLTIWLHNDFFVKVKPTIINLLFAGAIFGGLLFKQNVWKILFQSAFSLPERIWTVFAVRWGLFYLFLAALNLVVWKISPLLSDAKTPDDFWVNFKGFGVIPLTFLFAALNIPLMMKHMDKTDEPTPSA